MIILTVVAIIEIVLLSAAFVFLLHIRLIMKPAESWWSFLIRDVLWIVLAVGNFAAIFSASILTDEMVMLIQGVIIGLFLFSIWLRYRLHIDYQKKLNQVQPEIERLEGMRQRHGGDNWNQAYKRVQ